MKTRRYKGGANIYKLTGYYNTSDGSRDLIDFRIEKTNDKDAAEAYFKKHKVWVGGPPKGLLEELLDLFTFNQAYESKAINRVNAFLSDVKPNYQTETKYVMVNDKDDIKNIKTANMLIDKLAEIKRNNINRVTGGGGDTTEKTTEDTPKDVNKEKTSEENMIPIEKYEKLFNLKNQLKQELEKNTNTDLDKASIDKVLNSGSFLRILAKYADPEIKTDNISLFQPQAQAQAQMQSQTQSNYVSDSEKLDNIIKLVTDLANSISAIQPGISAIQHSNSDSNSNSNSGNSNSNSGNSNSQPINNSNSGNSNVNQPGGKKTQRRKKRHKRRSTRV